MRLQALNRLTNLFNKLAGIREDMAKRIMFSILPHVASPTEIYGTEGVIDIKALRAAVEGRKDIIALGVRVVGKELGHYFNYSRDDLLNEYWGAVGTDELENAMKLAVTAFKDKKKWVGGFGGEPWARIAEVLLKIIVLDNQLTTIKQSQKKSPTPNDTDLVKAEIETMRQLVVALNVFDGLSHNTASIMKNIVSEEIERANMADKMREGEIALPNVPDTDEAMKQYDAYNQVVKLMDAKELSDPLEAFKIIEPILQGTGDIHRFKDWVSKLHRIPEYRRTNPNTIEELKFIRLRKNLISIREDSETSIEHISKSLEKLEKHFISYNEAPTYMIDNLGKEILHAEQIANNIQMGFFPAREGNALRALRHKLIANRNQVTFSRNSLGRTKQPEDIQKFINLSKEFLNNFKALKFFLDAI